MEDVRLLHARQDVPDCDECDALDENPAEFAKNEICPGCIWMQEVQEPIIFKLLDYLALQTGGCPIGRHELTNEEWRLLGLIKSELEKIGAESRETRDEEEKWKRETNGR